MDTNPNPITPVSTQDLRALLAERFRQAAGQEPASPLSFAQQRLWFLDQLEPNSPRYNIPSVARLDGKLQVDALEYALEAIVARHETLRTRIVSTEGQPSQVIDPPCPSKLRRIDLSHLPSEQRQPETERLIAEEVNRPFDLGAGPLLRAVLLELQPEEHVLILNMHHIISDEWSLKIFFRELASLYEGHLTGQVVDLPELPIQYADFAHWQRNWLQGQVFEKQLAYWKEQLQGTLSGVELPIDHPRRSHPSSRGAVLLRPFGQALAKALRQYAQQEGATLFMVLLAAFKALLHRYTQQEDLVVGSPVAGRTRVETEGLIGFFVNTLPLRTRICGDPTFRQLLAQVRETALGAYSHQELPFERLVQELQPERALTHTPFLNVMFLIQENPEEVHLSGLTIQFLDRVTDTSKFEITLGVEDSERGMLAAVEYKTELFEAATITRLLEHYETLLQGVVANPDQRLSELPLLSEAEREELLAKWSPPATAGSPRECLHRGFEAQAESAPEATALVFEDQSLSYGALNARANQLAHYLQRLGVKPETPVALHFERSPNMLVAILAVLKAGGAYVPLDPHYPKERLSFMLEDAAAPVLLTEQALRPTLPANVPQLVCLDADYERIAAEPNTNPASDVTSDNAAYIIYTSGSTGQPKGVIVTHQNVVRLFRQTEPWYQFGRSDVWTLFHSYTFDFSVWEIWGALLYGGRLVVVPYLVSRSPAEFYQLLAKARVTVLNQTPSAFRQLLLAATHAPAEPPLDLRYVVFGGEALELQSLQPWFDRYGDQKPVLVNMYGITETTVHVTYRPIRQADLLEQSGSVIGVPIPDLRVYLLDEKLRPVPVGVPGEICVSGAGVARGYLHRPELTGERFLPDPYSREPGARLYRSGDLARYTAQGELEYLGRMDHQVKIRGFRVELGEIESALNRHPAIRESVVLAADGPGGEKRLVAYLVPAAGAPTVEELREHLGKQLPEHMIPSAFVPLPALPLTSNGKVDRRALPAADCTSIVSSRNCVAPRNPTEETLVEIWSELLGRKDISIHDNFFHLGGHSLLATQAISRIAGMFNVDLPVRAIFEAPTAAGLAEAVQRAAPAQAGAVSTITRRERGGGKANSLLSRLSQLSEAELQELLQNPKLKKALS